MLPSCQPGDVGISYGKYWHFAPISDAISPLHKKEALVCAVVRHKTRLRQGWRLGLMRDATVRVQGSWSDCALNPDYSRAFADCVMAHVFGPQLAGDLRSDIQGLKGC